MSVKRPLVGLARWWQERLKERGTKSPIWRPTARAERKIIGRRRLTAERRIWRYLLNNRKGNW